MEIEEHKTSKQRPVPILPELRRIVELCWKGRRKPENYLFVRTRFYSDKPISKPALIQRVKDAFEIAGIRNAGNLGAHTLRKTFGVRWFEASKENGMSEERVLIELSQNFNHASTEVTRRYIRLSEAAQVDVWNNF